VEEGRKRSWKLDGENGQRTTGEICFVCFVEENHSLYRIGVCLVDELKVLLGTNIVWCDNLAGLVELL